MDTLPFPGAIRQFAYVIDDIDESIARWVAVGVGPWYVMRSLPQTGTTYRGAETEPMLSIGFANSGDMQIELIQQHNNAPSIYREFLDVGRTGMHHVAYWAEDFDGTMARANAAGYQTAQLGRSAGTGFAYVDGGPAAEFIEVMELNDLTRGMMELIRNSAATWDGKDAVRNLG
jgi:glyoxalase/bleomycin resistance protein/dioxygenase superfamily protein